MFGDKVGFLNLRVATEKDGFPLPSYVFIRGPGSLAILMIIVNDKLLRSWSNIEFLFKKTS